MQLNKIYPYQTDFSIIHKIKYYPKTKQLQIQYITRTVRIIHNVEVNDLVFNMYKHHKKFKVIK